MSNFDRRHFLTLSAALAATSWRSGAFADNPVSADKRLKKAVKFGMVQGNASILEKFQLLKELGYDGVEMDSPAQIDRAEVVSARDKTGLTVHGVVDSVHWKETLSHPDAAVRARGVAGLKTALEDSKYYGGTTVLLVPAVVNKEVSYDAAYERSQAEIRKVLPLAEDLGIKIALENVWNQFLLSPLETARYIDEFKSPAIGAYFDVGNVVNYGWPEQWIKILGPRIMKLDIKEFSRKERDARGTWHGFEVEIGDGDCDWPAVMRALAEIDFRGWATAEVGGGDRQRLAEIAARMDKAFAS